MEYPGDSDKYSRLQQNNRDKAFEYATDVRAVEDVLAVDNHANVLDIGSGVGRASVTMAKMFDVDACFWLLDGEGEKQVTGINQAIGKHFYNKHRAAIEFCLANGIAPECLNILDAADMKASADFLTVNEIKFDLAYSFRALGFHWPISPMLDWLAEHMLSYAAMVFESRPLESSAYPTKHKFDAARKLVQRDIDYLIDSPFWQFIEYRTREVGPHLRAFVIAIRKGV